MKFGILIIFSLVVSIFLWNFAQFYFWFYLKNFCVDSIYQSPPNSTEIHEIINAWKPLLLFSNNPRLIFRGSNRPLKLMFYQYISILVKYKKELDGSKLRIDYFEELLNDEISKYVEIEPPIILYSGNADPLDIIACAFLGTRDYKYLEMLDKYSETDMVARFPYDSFISDKDTRLGYEAYKPGKE